MSSLSPSTKITPPPRSATVWLQLAAAAAAAAAISPWAGMLRKCVRGWALW